MKWQSIIGNLTLVAVMIKGAFDWDFKNLNPDFPKWISPPRNPSSGWILIKKSKSGFFGFPFYRSIGKSEKGFAKLFS